MLLEAVAYAFAILWIRLERKLNAGSIKQMMPHPEDSNVALCYLLDGFGRHSDDVGFACLIDDHPNSELHPESRHYISIAAAQL